ncbi:hypothetical protein M011DRAFT_473298 [Sporormia fimetaria CBS 119925]|uniref:Uncharacterized protein n=1 Tax=Sporormia fimetaria CBS 119925 TaxID=1340428 RepID=A0A6A6VQC3_9PLEO|nr:hypothetical protein M011DRAFT_473298 [Sporormia fimetaria CBS 119925]
MPPTQLSAAYPSPKRKRDGAPVVPPLNTSLRTAVTPPQGSPELSASDSPRNAVADQLRGLIIAPNVALVPPLTPTDNMVRKKPKLADMGDQIISTPSNARDEPEPVCWVKGPMAALVGKPLRRPGSKDEIPETPQPPRTFTPDVTLPQPVVFVSGTQAFSEETSTTQTKAPKPKTGNSQTHSRNKSRSPPPGSLTWQDSEITGHLADPSTEPDDDGTGINGIGFKPTPAIAYARAQKRRQQLIEWRARETREARAKRSERRRRGIGASGTASREGTVERETVSKDTTRRAVRFAM